MRQTEGFKKRGLVLQSRSPYASPAIFVPNPTGEDGKMPMSNNYNALNAITINNRLPLPFCE
jgi:hypothetical protein